MRRILTLLIVVTSFYSIALGKQVDFKTAEIVGLNFLTKQTRSPELHQTKHLQLVYTSYSSGAISDLVSGTVNYFYVFNTEGNGFVIVSADDIVIPILGYSDEDSFNSGKMHISINKWLEGYKDQIRYAISNDLSATNEIKRSWEKLINGTNDKSPQEILLGVEPLVQTKWDQSPYYNDLCPYDAKEGEKAVTGCVATAMAQLMKYWEYPETGAGFHSYNHSKYGTLSANFGNVTYEWSSMPLKISGPNDAIATLMYHCGISVDMDYNVGSEGGSSAQTLDVVDALKTYFGYPATIEGLYRTSYTDAQWLSLLKTELNASRPIQYAGTGSGGGHSFICDGYDNYDYFHFNWGWGGSEDGYFLVDALNPGSLGTGGGTGGFNTNQRAIIGVKSPTGVTTYNLEITEDVSPSANDIGYGNAFSITTNITNYGSNKFQGDYCAAAFDEYGNFIDYIATLSNYSLSGGNTYSNSLVFNSPGNFSMLPGTYDVYIFYRPTGGNWKIISNSDGSYYYTTAINIVNYNDIEMNSAIEISPATLTQGSPATVNLNILNDGFDSFSGEYDVSLYTLEGDFVESIGSFSETDLPGGYTYTSPFLDFYSPKINAEPGSYLLAVEHKWSNGNWELTGSSYYQNPVIVTVQAAPLNPDQYEVNNTAAKAYNLPVNFTNSLAKLHTTGSNCHTGNDYDYYKVVLPSGFKYTIGAKVQDSYSATNGNTYTLDALFSYSTNGGNSWSDAFDEETSSNIILENGGTVYFFVSPYYTGETGTYLLDIDILKSAKTAVDNILPEGLISVYPNPVTERITIDLGNLEINPNQLSLIDMQGKLMLSSTLQKNDHEISLELSEIPNGLYLLKINTREGIITKKILVAR